MSLWFPEVKDVLLIHQRIAAYTGGSTGVREIGLIESALARAHASFGGVDAYPDLIGKAAAVGCGLTQNHGFIDGNKRIGVMTMLLMLRRNGVRLAYTQEELVTLSLSLAQGLLDAAQTEAWVRAHLSP